MDPYYGPAPIVGEAPSLGQPEQYEQQYDQGPALGYPDAPPPPTPAPHYAPAPHAPDVTPYYAPPLGYYVPAPAPLPAPHWHAPHAHHWHGPVQHQHGLGQTAESTWVGPLGWMAVGAALMMFFSGRRDGAGPRR